MTEQPLRGRRIALTRPREQAGALAEALERLGATVFVVPLVAIEPLGDTTTLDAALEALGGYDWLVFTSANGVAAVRERLADPAALRPLRVAAVGPATAKAVRRLGVEPAFVPDRYAAEEIAAGLEPLLGSRVLLPQADIADTRLADELGSRGATVDAIAAYRTVEIEPSGSGKVTLTGADAVVLASGSAARSLPSLAGSLEGIHDRALVVCIGPKTAEIAREVGLPVDLVAHEATSEGIIQALVTHFEDL